MSLPVVVAAAMFLGVLCYAVLAGADFGSGFFDLTAGNAARGGRVRVLVDHSIGPVWEANHVWLIYILVFWWTAFPTAFAATMTTLFVPFTLALLGIVLRGASFAFRKFAATLAQAQLFGAIFASSSVLSPFFLGAIAGSIASGRVPAGGHGDPWTSWLNPTSVLGGLIAVGTCCFLAGTFLTADAARAGDGELAELLRRKTMVLGVLTGLVVLAGLLPLRHDARTLATGLQGRGAVFVVLSALAGTATLLLLRRRSFALARFGAIGAVGAVLLGWAAGQYPWLLVDQLRIDQAAGARATLWGLLIVVALAAVLVVPALGYLLWLTQQPAPRRLSRPEFARHADSAGNSGREMQPGSGDVGRR